MTAELLSELARVKAVFQLRAITTVLGLPPGPSPRADNQAASTQPVPGIIEADARDAEIGRMP